MSEAPVEIEALIEMMAKLPGLGPRSARRAVLHLIGRRGQLMAPLAEAMASVASSARECLNCGNISSNDICGICESEKRATGEICVVADVADLWAMERAGAFRGRYHILGGTLSALDAVGRTSCVSPPARSTVVAKEDRRGDHRPRCHSRRPRPTAHIHRRCASRRCWSTSLAGRAGWAGTRLLRDATDLGGTQKREKPSRPQQ